MNARRTLCRAIPPLLLFVPLWTGHPAAQESLLFQDAGDYAEVLHDSVLAPPELTVELWLRVHDLGDPDQAGGEQTFLDKRWGGTGYSFRLAGTEFPLAIAAIAEPTMVLEPEVIESWRWYHVAMTQDADTLRLFLDGVEVQKAPNTYLSATESPLGLGDLTGCPGGCLWLRGEIDDLRIWDHARTPGEIAATLHEKLTGSEPGLIGYWDFDGETGATFTDRTANGNDGFLYGNASFEPSWAPVGFVPPATPLGIRTYTDGSSIQCVWMPGEADVVSYAIYRSDTDTVETSPAARIAVVGPVTSYSDAAGDPDRTYYYRLEAIGTEGGHSLATSPYPGRRVDLPKDHLVGAYYFLHYGSQGEGWTDACMRDFLVPAQPPALGHYGSGDASVIARHLDWMYEYGIDFLAANWWGPGSVEDEVLLQDVLPELEGRPTSFCIHYQTLRLGDPVNGEIVIDAALEDTLVADFQYLADHYFGHPNYLRIDGRPVVFLYRSRFLAGDYEQAFEGIRSDLLGMGYDLYLVGDEISRMEPRPDHMQFLDALTIHRGLSRTAPEGTYPLEGPSFGGIARTWAVWQAAASSQGKPVVPVASPGSNSRAVNPTYWIIPRESLAGAGPTSSLEEYLRILRSYVDPGTKLIMISTWNEWSSDTQVEPSIVTPSTTEDASGVEHLYTGGFSYTGYGTQCLEVIQSYLGYDPGQVILVEPENGTPDTPLLVHLAWASPEGAQTFHVQVTEDPSFASLLLEVDRVDSTSYEIGPLEKTTTYYWRVRGQSSGGSGAWSTPFEFTTGSQVPVLLAYFRAERGEADEVRLTWRVLESRGHAGFHVYRSRDGGERMRISADLLSGGTEYVFTDSAPPWGELHYWLQELGRDGQPAWYGPVSVGTRNGGTLRLFPNRPNPVRAGTEFRFELPSPGEVTLQVMDVRGRIVAVPHRGRLPLGIHAIPWDGRDRWGRSLPSGVYMYRVSTELGVQSRKLLLLH